MGSDNSQKDELYWSDPSLADACDDLPLWSAPFGLALLDAVELRRDIVAVDVGCGTGFPAIELAQRLGPGAQVHGVDPCGAALCRARKKVEALGVANVVLHEVTADALPFPDGAIDLVVSNNGFNNVADADAALRECARVAKPGAQLVYAHNLPGTMCELYGVFDEVLAERGRESERAALAAHIHEKRKTTEFTIAQIERVGFGIERVVEGSFHLRFLDAEALFGHALIRLAFAPSWKEIVAPPDRRPVFEEIARRLDATARDAGCLSLTVPFACCDCRRRG